MRFVAAWQGKVRFITEETIIEPEKEITIPPKQLEEIKGKVSTEFEAYGLKCRVVLIKYYINEKVKLMLSRNRVETEWYCGYVGIPKSHILYHISYEKYGEPDIELQVHGGITYTCLEKDGLYWIGFDCAHYGDNIIRWDFEAVKKETKKLAGQISHIK